MNIVVVESPSKAKTINKYLGPGYEVLASFGHIRDLPPKDGSVDPDNNFHMLWEVDAQVEPAHERHRPRAQGRRQADPRHRPGSRGRSDLLARAGSAEGKEGAQGSQDRARRLQRHHQAGGDRGDAASARDRRRAGRCLSRPPRARLSGRLHALAGALAQAARRPLGRPRAIGRAAAGLRPRTRNREIRRQGILVDRRQAGDPAQRQSSRRAWSAPTARRSSASTSARAPRPKPSPATSKTRPSTLPASRQSRRAAIRRRPSPPRRCSRKPAASSALPRRSPCVLRSGSTKASRSTARPPASSPICVPTASTWRRKRLPTSAPCSASNYGKEYVPASPREYHNKSKNAQEAHEAVRPTSASRTPARSRQICRSRSGAPLRADLEPRGREPDGIRRARAHHRRHRCQGRRTQHRTARLRPGGEVRRLPDALSGRPGRDLRGR